MEAPSRTPGLATGGGISTRRTRYLSGWKY